jgi:hypothetical protein
MISSNSTPNSEYFKYHVAVIVLRSSFILRSLKEFTVSNRLDLPFPFAKMMHPLCQPFLLTITKANGIRPHSPAVTTSELLRINAFILEVITFLFPKGRTQGVPFCSTASTFFLARRSTLWLLSNSTPLRIRNSSTT